MAPAYTSSFLQVSGPKIDVYYAVIDRIWDVYLFDAVAQAVILLMWAVHFVRLKY